MEKNHKSKANLQQKQVTGKMRKVAVIKVTSLELPMFPSASL